MIHSKVTFSQRAFRWSGTAVAVMAAAFCAVTAPLVFAAPAAAPAAPPAKAAAAPAPATKTVAATTQVAPQVQAAPVAGTTLIDRLQARADQPRTTPTFPQAGVWGIVMGQPVDADGNGLRMDNPGQAIVYPTTTLVTGPTGTIEFTVVTGADDADTHNLLDSWPNAGNGRFQLQYTSGKLHLVVTSDGNQQTVVDGPVTWPADSSHRVTILWDATKLELQSDGITVGSADSPKMLSTSPLALVLGSDRDLQKPGKVAVSTLRLSIAREPSAPALPSTPPTQTADDITTAMSLGYQQNLNPVFDKIRGQNASVTAFDAGAAAADISDFDRANQALAPILANTNDPMYAPAVFLKADILAAPPDPNYQAAFDQLEVLAGSANADTSVKAQVKQAVFLYDEGNKSGSEDLISALIAKYNNTPAINAAYLMVGQNRFESGDFREALDAFRAIGLTSKESQKSGEIGQPILIKVADADLNSRTNNATVDVNVTSTTSDGKPWDKETVALRPAFSKGVYIGSIDTELGEPKPADGKLQVVGGATVTISYVDDTKQTHTQTVALATDGALAMMSESAVDVYHEIRKLQKANVVDQNWILVGNLPASSSDFFRDPADGTLRKKGTRFDATFLSNIKPGQNIYFELTEPDLDPAEGVGTATVEVNTQNGKTAAVKLTETGPHTGIFAGTLKTCKAGSPEAGSIEVTDNDHIRGHYDDKTPAIGPNRTPHPDPTMTVATQYGDLMVGQLVPDPDASDEDRKVFLRAWRIPTGAPITVQVTDRDLDISDLADKATVHLHATGGVDKDLTLTETGTHTGIFAGTFTVSPSEFAAKQGDQLAITYNDVENPSGKPISVDYDTKVNIAENATIKFERQIVEEQKYDKDNKPAWLPPPTVTYKETKNLAPGYVYRVTLVDPDIIPSTAGEFYTKVTMKASNGSTADVQLRAQQDNKTHEISFVGSFFCRLGDSGSPSKAYFSQTGSVVELSDDTDVYTLASIPALNVQGNDSVSANYIEPLTADGGHDVARSWPLQIASDAIMTATNEQGVDITQIKPGTKFILQIEDPDGDITPKRDTITASISAGGRLPTPITLSETDVHSGIFTAEVDTAYAATTPATLNVVLVPFDSKVAITYHDAKNDSGAPIVREMDLTTNPVADATATMLTKVYDDPKFEVETLVRLGESLYAVGAADLAEQPATDPTKGRTNAHLQEAAVLLQQVVDRFPTSDYVTESLYLLGKIRREEKKYDEANKLFQKVVDNYPDSDFVPQALYQQVLLHYDQHDIDSSTESAMRLVYGYPQNPLVADAFLRIAEFYYDGKQYLTSAYIYRRVVERFPDNPRVPLVYYRMATAYYRAGIAGDNASLASAVKYYIEFANQYKDNELADDSLYWAASACLKQHDAKRAYTILTKSLIAYPDGDMRAYAARLRDKIKQDNPGIEADQDD